MEKSSVNMYLCKKTSLERHEWCRCLWISIFWHVNDCKQEAFYPPQKSETLYRWKTNSIYFHFIFGQLVSCIERLWQVEVFIPSGFWSVVTEWDSDMAVCVCLDHWSGGWHSLSINCICTDKNKIIWHVPALLVAFSGKTNIQEHQGNY